MFKIFTFTLLINFYFVCLSNRLHIQIEDRELNRKSCLIINKIIPIQKSNYITYRPQSISDNHNYYILAIIKNNNIIIYILKPKDNNSFVFNNSTNRKELLNKSHIIFTKPFLKKEDYINLNQFIIHYKYLH